MTLTLAAALAASALAVAAAPTAHAECAPRDCAQEAVAFWNAVGPTSLAYAGAARGHAEALASPTAAPFGAFASCTGVAAVPEGHVPNFGCSIEPATAPGAADGLVLYNAVAPLTIAHVGAVSAASQKLAVALLP